jgi:molybdopterin synthase sulfur carrier subunit
MGTVRIKIPRYLQDKTDGQVFAEVEGASVRECIGALIKQYPELAGELLDDQGRLLLKWMLYVNDHAGTPPDELFHPVKDGDTISLFPIISGG